MLRSKLLILVPLIIFSLLSGCSPVNSKHNNDAWFGHDKRKHFVVAAAIGAGTAIASKNKGGSDCDAATAGITMSLVLGSGKEYHDKYNRKKYWSWKDMFWNLVGGTVGSLAAARCL